MDILDRREAFINSLTHEEKVAIAISVIKEEIERLKKQLKETDSSTSKNIINQMIYELDSAKDHL